ncbi:16S rRNA (guanine(527)-N(7))-methyltransferase RsmG [Legionella yabuuchiae]|uniref:16S rRNA (guanine(527)-N(7))-methyltransferase RsmG n=1 Tax=Legionella yabuuchiae TaxID=376727 RepID=UPI0010559AA5|nr:16S rRNA (guanine(527)-N(7))-methyltransferase RsmG [Legionella yabuuchiae]
MSFPQNVQEQLEQGLRQLGLYLSPEPFLIYLQLLHKWNQAYNLTAVRDMTSMVSRHILDSLAILPWVKGQRIIDVGTGPGLPGIPLALANPDKRVVLLDSNGKKIRFLQEVKRMLSLNQIEIVQSRVENYHPTQGFDTVISRAFSDLTQMLTWTSHLIAADGIWLAMKGRIPEDELKTIAHPYQVVPYTVPGLEGQRCCVIINR